MSSSRSSDRPPKVLVANRGEIACRIMRTLGRMGLGSVAVYSDADRESLHVRMAGEAFRIGPAPARESYLAAERILEVARRAGVAAIHPGYGFLSENAPFAAACEAEGIAFVGPTAAQISRFGLKHTAREVAVAAGIPLLEGSGLLADAGAAVDAARAIGFPVMVKATAGGGGIGMQVCRDEAELATAFTRVQRLGGANFADAGVYLERFVERARHVEVQVFGDGEGGVVALGERDCSMQRRNQKVIEESPAPGLPCATRQALHDAAVRLAHAVGYRSAGTVEFLYDPDRKAFHFLEVNTRLQVEHGVTEEVWNIDLVEWMVRLALGTLPPLSSLAVSPTGHSIEARIYAEDPAKAFRPSAGLLTDVSFPDGVRIDTWIERGTEVPGDYDPLLAKVIAVASTRDESISKLRSALSSASLHGIETNRLFLLDVLDDAMFRAGDPTTRLVEGVAHAPPTVDVLEPGLMTTVQDYPGRVGYWAVGVPPSGPMDSLSARFANRILGNPEGAAVLEITAVGPSLRFHVDAVVCLTGAPLSTALPVWEPVRIAAGETITLGAVGETGQRAYLAVAGGFQVPDYLGSRSTFTLGRFGGHGGRALVAGDVLHLDPGASSSAPGDALPPGARPAISNHWELAVLSGPHGAPDFFTEHGLEAFLAAGWEVHYHSSRTGVRLIGPKPEWARADGGEAGLHPSNIHDNAYAVGAVDFTGDMPVILGPDGPSLGGFVCPVTLAKADLWKLGQLRPGDTVCFRPVTTAEAHAMEDDLDQRIASLGRDPSGGSTAPRAPSRRAGHRAGSTVVESPILHVSGDVVYRRSGDENLLVEFGPNELDIALRFRVHEAMRALAAQCVPGVLDLTPGIRSLQVHFDRRRSSFGELIERIEASGHGERVVPSRTVHLPLSWDDEACRLAIERYVRSVRADAPWCPSNIEFIRRINGLDGIDEVKRIVFDASYLVMGLGDVYLGAPVATPLDPRHRLVTTKYNPARTWTPENAVGIGGAYLCVYGMEGPGGYQFVGRTCQMWNRFRHTPEFIPGKPWLLRFFDRIRFHEVDHDELRDFRADFPTGRVGLEIEEGTFDLDAYERFLAEHAEEIDAFRSRQRQAFADERARWQAAGEDLAAAAPEPVAPADIGEPPLPEGCAFVTNQVAGNLWKVEAPIGTAVQAGDTVMIVESMKMEIFVAAPLDGIVEAILCAESSPVTAGQRLAVIRPNAAP